ncbi:hypothetical protein AB4Z51_37385 [Bradyrhizobium sp. 2TAF36]|uniref:hypothetical protein n=1 Tax=Bradyrhizobium sp. 2TAF36 TaxID=3233016 RepID=UPI003F8F364E
MNDDDDDDDDLGRLILANTRKWNSFWYWRDKPVGERGIAREVLEAAKAEVTDLRSVGQDPPYCEATLDGQFSGIEVTELVHRPTLERSIKAVRQRARGEEPRKPEAYFNWGRDDLVDALQNLLDLKIRNRQCELTSGTCSSFTPPNFSWTAAPSSASCSSGLISRAFIGLEHEPGKGYPVFELDLVRV